MIGPSGCGKSTIGHLLAGYESPTSGRHRRRRAPRDRTVRTAAPALPGERAHAVADDAAERDVRPPRPRCRRRGRPARVDPAPDPDGSEGVLDRYPGELSGGMQRRAELARALVNRPHVLVLDEPFRGLDAMTRELMQEYVAELLTEDRRTTLFVTTDVDEALLLADRVLVMAPARPGRAGSRSTCPDPGAHGAAHRPASPGRQAGGADPAVRPQPAGRHQPLSRHTPPTRRRAAPAGRPTNRPTHRRTERKPDPMRTQLKAARRRHPRAVHRRVCRPGRHRRNRPR